MADRHLDPMPRANFRQRTSTSAKPVVADAVRTADYEMLPTR